MRPLGHESFGAASEARRERRRLLAAGETILHEMFAGDRPIAGVGTVEAAALEMAERSRKTGGRRRRGST